MAVCATAAFATVVLVGVSAGAGNGGEAKTFEGPSGVTYFKDVELGNFLTECPQAGLKNAQPKPLDRRAKDDAEKKGDAGNDIRVNQDYACLPQDETSISVNPVDTKNLVAGANDYRLGTGSSGFYASSDGGEHWYDGIIPFPSAPAAQSRGEGFIISAATPRSRTIGRVSPTTRRSGSSAATIRTASSSSGRRTAASRGAARVSEAATRRLHPRVPTPIRASRAMGWSTSTRTTTCS